MATSYNITLQKAADRTRKLTRTNTATLTDAEMITLCNETVLDIEREMAENGVEDFGVVGYTNVNNAKGYDKPTNLIKYQRLEINYGDINNPSDWRKMHQVDVSNLPDVWQRFVTENAQHFPAFDDFGGEFYQAPIQSNETVAGLRIRYIGKIQEFASLSETLPYPINLYWDVIAFGNAYRYWLPINKEEASTYLGLFKPMVKSLVDVMSKPSQEQITTQVVDFTNYGYL